MSIVLSHPVCGALLVQPQKPDRPRGKSNVPTSAPKPHMNWPLPTPLNAAPAPSSSLLSRHTSLFLPGAFVFAVPSDPQGSHCAPPSPKSLLKCRPQPEACASHLFLFPQQ